MVDVVELAKRPWRWRKLATEPWRVREDMGPLVLVWGVWLVLAVVLFRYVNTYTVNVPWMDEWELIPALTGHQRVTLKWLWSLHNEHRIFIPRLLYLALVKTSRDFRAGSYFSATALTLSAAAMMIAARRLRRHTLYSDALIPVVSLHLGQWENLLFSLHIVWLSGAVLVIGVLLLIMQPGRLSFGAALGLAVCTILLPLCGGNGLAFVPACTVIVFMVGWQVRKVSHWGMRATAAIWALGLVAVAIAVFYFVDYTRPAKHPITQNFGQVLEATTQFLLGGLGSAAKTTWPDEKYIFYASLIATVVALVSTFISRSDERLRICRLILFFGAVLSLAGGTGWARKALSPYVMFSPRYSTAAAAFWFATYFAWEVVGHVQLRRTAQALLFVVAASFLVANRNEGIAWSGYGRAERLAVLTDFRLGSPLVDVAARHWDQVYYGLGMSVATDNPAGPDTFRARLQMVKDSRMGDFADLK